MQFEEIQDAQNDSHSPGQWCLKNSRIMCLTVGRPTGALQSCVHTNLKHSPGPINPVRSNGQ